MADWRVDNAKWTRGAVLHFKKYARPREDWDHDHCEGCWAKFMEFGPTEMLTEGFVTEDNQRWICAIRRSLRVHRRSCCGEGRRQMGVHRSKRAIRHCSTRGIS